MLPEEGDITIWMIEEVAWHNGKEAARRLAETLYLRILTGEEARITEAIETIFQLIDIVVAGVRSSREPRRVISPVEAEYIATIVGGVAKYDCKEAAFRLVNTLLQHMITGSESGLASIRQSAHALIRVTKPADARSQSED